MTLPRAVIVDIDGTQALRGDRDPYNNHDVGEDMPNSAVIELVRSLWTNDAWPLFILMVSGRKEIGRYPTELWMEAQYGMLPGPLFMRPDWDNSKDADLKERIFHEEIEGKYDVAFVIDDRDQCVAMWRRLGFTCFQCAPGDF